MCRMAYRPATTATRSALAKTDEACCSHSFINLSLYNLFWIFIIVSFFGLIGETILSAPLDGEFRNRTGLVWGPFSPLYGLGGVLMTVFLNDFRNRSPVLAFSVAAFVGGTLEYAAGWFWKNFFGIVAWSYEGQPLNFGGFTCARMMVVWGFIGLVWMYVGLPLAMRIMSHIPVKHRTLITAVMASFMAVDIVMTFGALNFWFERLAGIEATTPLQLFFAQNYGNEWMANHFQTMSLWTEIAAAR